MFDNIVKELQEGGSSPFFFTSAIQSAVFGEVGRRNQADLAESNMDFRREIQQIREEFSKERLEEQIAFRRESYEIGRAYLIEQTLEQNKSRKHEVEFLDFLKSEQYWPLNCDVYSMLNMQEMQLNQKVIPLRILIARTEVSEYDNTKPESSYVDCCQKIADGLSRVQNIEVLAHPWKKRSRSSICESMNLNFIMQGVPALILFPYQIGDTFGVEIAAWSLCRGRESMLHSKILKIRGYNATASIDKTIFILKTIAGMMRDSYIVAEYHLPIQFPQFIDKEILEITEVRQMIKTHYSGIANSIKNPAFHSICTQNEVLSINTSLKSIEHIVA